LRICINATADTSDSIANDAVTTALLQFSPTPTPTSTSSVETIIKTPVPGVWAVLHYIFRECVLFIGTQFSNL
jgi:hypothetical protein